MADKMDATVSHSDNPGEAQIKGVNNGALAVATIQQKPKLLSKSMLKVNGTYTLTLMSRQLLTNPAVLVYRSCHAQLLYQRIRRLPHGLHQQLRTIQIILRLRSR